MISDKGKRQPNREGIVFSTNVWWWKKDIDTENKIINIGENLGDLDLMMIFLDSTSKK